VNLTDALSTPLESAEESHGGAQEPPRWQGTPLGDPVPWLVVTLLALPFWALIDPLGAWGVYLLLSTGFPLA
jgi:hypothetical protein